MFVLPWMVTFCPLSIVTHPTAPRTAHASAASAASAPSGAPAPRGAPCPCPCCGLLLAPARPPRCIPVGPPPAARSGLPDPAGARSGPPPAPAEPAIAPPRPGGRPLRSAWRR